MLIFLRSGDGQKNEKQPDAVEKKCAVSEEAEGSERRVEKRQSADCSRSL